MIETKLYQGFGSRLRDIKTVFQQQLRFGLCSNPEIIIYQAVPCHRQAVGDNTTHNADAKLQTNKPQQTKCCFSNVMLLTLSVCSK